MRMNYLLNLLTVLCSIFGIVGLTIAIICGNDIIRAISSALLFVMGWIAANMYNRYA